MEKIEMFGAFAIVGALIGAVIYMVPQPFAVALHNLIAPLIG